jgi:hypothetical protein
MSGVFADHALELRGHGFAVLPARGKRPIVKGYTTWPPNAPSIATVAQWAEQFPDVNIGYVAGLSGLVVVDCDSQDEAVRCRQLYGETPGRIRTRRGEHLLYCEPTEPLPRLVNMRQLGLVADLKHGRGAQSIALVPPSMHPEGGEYAWIDCDPSVIRQLPPFDIDRLRRQLEQHQSTPTPDWRRRNEMRDGSRGQWLNDRLCGHAPHCDTFEELLDKARTLNDSLADRCVEPLSDEVVIDRTKKVWRDAQAGKLEKRLGRAGVAKSSTTEMEILNRLNPRKAPEALFLLMRLRIAHGARCKRGETFNITPKAMAESGAIPGWTRERIAKARDLLLESGFIQKVSESKVTPHGRVGAQYRLVTVKGAGAV